MPSGLGVGVSTSMRRVRRASSGGGVLLDLNPDYGITHSSNAVTELVDSAGRLSFTATGTARPTLNPGDTNYNGHNTLSFDGTTDRLRCAAAPVSAGRSHTWAFVVESADSSTTRWLLEFEGNGAGRIAAFWTLTTGGKHGKAEGTPGAAWSSSSPDTAIQDLVFVFDARSGLATLYEHGVNRGTVSYAGKALAGACSLAAVHAGNGAFFSGKIARAVIYDGAFTATQVEGLRGELSQTYGYPLA